MLLSDRRKFLGLLAVLPMAACGFQPVYKNGGAAKDIHGALNFNLIDSRDGFILLERLETRLGSGVETAQFDVTVTLLIEEGELILTAATALVAFTARNTVDGVAKISVIEKSSGDEVFTSKLRETVSYSRSEQTIVTASSRRAAYENLVLSLADQIVLRLTSTAESWAK